MDATLEAAGNAYHDHRAALMIARNEGLTKTYNRFHARGENAHGHRPPTCSPRRNGRGGAPCL